MRMQNNLPQTIEFGIKAVVVGLFGGPGNPEQ